jgi:hypothetical protein
MNRYQTAMREGLVGIDPDLAVEVFVLEQAEAV